MIIPTILKPPELAAIRERVQELIIFWSKYYMFETIADMPQYVQDAAALLGHIDALEIDKEQPNGSNVPGQEIPAGSDS